MEVYPKLVYTSVLLGHFGKTIPLQKKAKIPEYPYRFRRDTSVLSWRDCSPFGKGL